MIRLGYKKVSALEYLARTSSLKKSVGTEYRKKLPCFASKSKIGNCVECEDNK